MARTAPPIPWTIKNGQASFQLDTFQSDAFDVLAGGAEWTQSADDSEQWTAVTLIAPNWTDSTPSADASFNVSQSSTDDAEGWTTKHSPRTR
jgi:hypothetical protein